MQKNTKGRKKKIAKFEDRENRRRTSVVGSIVEGAPVASGGGRGRPKENREIKKRVSLSVMPSFYEDIQKIAYVQRRSISDLVSVLLEQYRVEHGQELTVYETLIKDS